MLWYNKYDSEELIQATEKIYEFFFRQTVDFYLAYTKFFCYNDGEIG